MSHRRSHVPSRLSFSLIELLVVVAIISVLASILLPTLSRARGIAKRTVCSSNLRQLNIQNNVYADENDEWFARANHTSAAIFYVDTKNAADFDSYFKDKSIFQCPDTQYLHSDYPQYGPGWRLNNGINATYRFYAARGSIETAASYYIYNGFYILGSRPTTASSQYCASIARRSFAGSMQKDAFAGTPVSYYIHSPSEQPAILDGMKVGADKWILYSSTRYVQNNHVNQHGINVSFIDGHVVWADQKSGKPRMAVGYWDGTMNW